MSSSPRTRGSSALLRTQGRSVLGGALCWLETSPGARRVLALKAEREGGQAWLLTWAVGQSGQGFRLLAPRQTLPAPSHLQQQGQPSTGVSHFTDEETELTGQAARRWQSRI